MLIHLKGKPFTYEDKVLRKDGNRLGKKKFIEYDNVRLEIEYYTRMMKKSTERHIKSLDNNHRFKYMGDTAYLPLMGRPEAFCAVSIT